MASILFKPQLLMWKWHMVVNAWILKLYIFCAFYYPLLSSRLLEANIVSDLLLQLTLHSRIDIYFVVNEHLITKGKNEWVKILKASQLLPLSSPFFFLLTELRASCLLGRYSTTSSMPSPSSFFLSPSKCKYFSKQIISAYYTLVFLTTEYILWRKRKIEQ
jgi:hypothetical protein